jgi:hypothetical protein
MAAPRHRAVRPRYGRLTAVAASVAVVAVALTASAGGWGERPAPHAQAPAVVQPPVEPSPVALVEPDPAASSAPPAK